MIEIIAIAIAIGMDAMAVAAAAGTNAADHHDPLGRGAVRLALVFGLFHLVMATFGCAAGAVAERWIGAWDHWVVFGVLVALGGKMLHSALYPPVAEARAFAWTMVMGLGFATSVDAIGAGIMLPMLDPPLPVSIVVIAGIAGLMTFIGFHAGRWLGERSRILEVAGALAVIVIGVKTLISSLAAG